MIGFIQILKKKRIKYGVIQRKDEKCGIGSYIITFLGGISYCIDKGLIPIIDMKTVNNIYKQDDNANSWDYFFVQPAGVELEDVVDTYSIEIIDSETVADRPKSSNDFLTNIDELSYWKKIAREYLVFSESAKSVIDAYLVDFLPDETREYTIGVLARGTDYSILKPEGHPIQPDLEIVIDKIKEVRQRTGYNRLFLATEDKHIFEELKKEFGDDLISPDSNRFEIKEKEYLADVIPDELSMTIAYDYLASLVVLSKCKCLIAGRTSGSVVAKLLSDGYQEEHFFDLGLYGVDE